MNEHEVLDLMLNSQTEQEWNDNTRKVKETYGGHYPDFWYGAIVMSGLARKVAAQWGGTDEIKITAVQS